MEELLKYLFLGLLQGFTEPIPVSSSGHLVIAQHFLGMSIEGFSFEVIVNFASLLAVLIIYRKDLIRLSQNSWAYIRKPSDETKSDFQFVKYLVIASIPAGVLGFLVADILSENLKGIGAIGITLLVTGVALWLIKSYQGKRMDEDLTTKDAWLVGLAQSVALIPGISRSGATIVASMFLGMSQQTALRFSFLLYIPVSVGAMIFGISDLMNDPEISTLVIPYLVAFISALVMSYFALRWFMGIMAKGKLVYFSLYCFALGGFLLIYSFFL